MVLKDSGAVIEAVQLLESDCKYIMPQYSFSRKIAEMTLLPQGGPS